jgi:N-methylhydantoinase B
MAMDGGAMAIIANRFEGLARRMAATLVRSGHSGVLNRAKDLSCCIVSRDHQMVAAADSLPAHVLSGPDLMSRSLYEMHPDPRPGDAYLNNSPYHGCSHAADYTVIVPVFDAAERHRFSVLVKAHQADIGNSIPTTYFAGAVDVYNEGALIFPNTKVAENWRLNADFVRQCQLRIRSPGQWLGDFHAMLGSAWLGERGLQALAAEFGWDRLDDFVTSWLDYGELTLRSAIAALPAGTAVAACCHDPMPGTPAGGIPARATVTIDPKAQTIRVDYRDNIDCMPNGLNLSEACARSAALIGIFNSLPGNFPKNAGTLRPVEILLRDGAAIGVPRHPASCSAATTNLADRAAAAVQLAMAAIGEGAGAGESFGMAEVGSVNPPSKGVISGRDWRNGRAMVDQLFLGSTGGAAHAQGDGWLTNSHVGNAGMSLVDSVELVEYCHPLVVEERMLVPDSEGAGTFIGAPSLETVFRVTGGEVRIVYASDCTVHPARGVRGGHGGTAADQRLAPAGEAPARLPNWAQLALRAGDRVISRGAGGGGFGPPARRDPMLVRRDVADGLITPARARDVYALEDD